MASREIYGRAGHLVIRLSPLFLPLFIHSFMHLLLDRYVLLILTLTLARIHNLLGLYPFRHAHRPASLPRLSTYPSITSPSFLSPLLRAIGLMFQVFTSFFHIGGSFPFASFTSFNFLSFVSSRF